MFSSITDLLPKTLALGATAWGAACYFFVGPEVGARIAHFDHYPTCRAHYGELIKRAADKERQSLSPPSTEDDISIAYTRKLMENPLMRGLGDLGGWGSTMDQSLSMLEAKQRAAREEFDRAAAEIEASTRRKLANSDGFCGCVADAAIDNARNEWALYAATLGFISSSKVENFGAAMTQDANVSACTGAAREKADD